MTTTTNQKNKTKMGEAELLAIITELGPKFASRASQHDSDGSFVAENFQEMKE